MENFQIFLLKLFFGKLVSNGYSDSALHGFKEVPKFKRLLHLLENYKFDQMLINFLKSIFAQTLLVPIFFCTRYALDLSIINLISLNLLESNPTRFRGKKVTAVAHSILQIEYPF